MKLAILNVADRGKSFFSYPISLLQILQGRVGKSISTQTSHRTVLERLRSYGSSYSVLLLFTRFFGLAVGMTPYLQ
jgi:hypothetical protein